MRSPGWYALAIALVATAVTVALHVALVYVSRSHVMLLPVILTALASTVIWAGYVTRAVGEKWGAGTHALTALALVVVGGLVGFVFLYATGYVGLAVVLAAYVSPLFQKPGTADAQAR